MRREIFVGALMLFGISISLTAGAKQAAAQGPAGVGAGAAVQDSSHSYNPIAWFKKDPKNSADTPTTRADIEKTLTPSLQSQGILAAPVNATDACAPFATLETCLGALHASRNLGMDFNCLRADVTGVLTNANLSDCKFAGDGKAQSLHNAIRQLKPDADAKQATRDAEQQARVDLKAFGG
jgi:hypothetical protein